MKNSKHLVRNISAVLVYAALVVFPLFMMAHSGNAFVCSSSNKACQQHVLKCNYTKQVLHPLDFFVK
jgi:hypothetical protein